MSATVRQVSWSRFKLVVSSGGLSFTHKELDKSYLVSAFDGLFTFFCEISNNANSADAIDFINNYLPRSNNQNLISQSVNVPVVATRKEERDYSTIVSHNFCDNTTWVAGTGDSSWHLEPTAGDIMVLSRSEIQFKHDLDLTNNKVKLDYYAWIGGGAEAVIQTIEFDKIENIFELGNAHFESSLFGGLTTVQFNQEYQLVLYGSDNPGKLKRVHVYSDSHSEVAGSYVTASFVTETRDQP
jgi:hypothetical protein